MLSKIGTFGDVIFEVSNKTVLTFKDYNRNGSARWTDHEILNQKQKSEFIGPGLDDITFTIYLSASLGVNPAKEILKLRKMKDTGKVAPFVLGGKPISSNYWSLQGVNEGNEIRDNQGILLAATVELTLREYVIKKTHAKKTTSKKRKVSGAAKNKPVSKVKKLGVITIIVKSVHIRSGPSTNAKVIGYAMKNDKLTVTSEKNGWYSLGQGKYITANAAYSTLKKG